MKALMALFFHEEWCYNQWASWPLGYIGSNQPELIQPYLQKMVSNLDHAGHNAVVRTTLKIFGDIDIPEELEGQLFDKCFNYLSNPKYAIAIRVFSMTVLYRIVQNHPDLKPELIAEIEEHMPHGSAGFKSRGRKTLKLLKKDLK